jgi:hypothetical protein
MAVEGMGKKGEEGRKVGWTQLDCSHLSICSLEKAKTGLSTRNVKP